MAATKRRIRIQPERVMSAGPSEALGPDQHGHEVDKEARRDDRGEPELEGHGFVSLRRVRTTPRKRPWRGTARRGRRARQDRTWPRVSGRPAECAALQGPPRRTADQSSRAKPDRRVKLA